MATVTVPGGGGTTITFTFGGSAACYLRGTRIRAETVAGGDRAETYSGLGAGGDILIQAGAPLTLGPTERGAALDHDEPGRTLGSSDQDDLFDYGGTIGVENLLIEHPKTPGDDAAVTQPHAAEIAEVPIENLAIGDRVVTLDGEARPIRWIGQRAYDGRFIAGNRQTLPIRISAGALADGVPLRDLWVSPAHSLYLDDVLVPSEHLVNGLTIVQPEKSDSVEYFHIELDSHDIVFAEGAPAETYAESDNRMMFANAAEFARLYPNDDRPARQFCAPLLEWGSEQLVAIRGRLLKRASALGHVTGLDFDPDLHLRIDRDRLRPDRAAELTYRFTIPAGVGEIWIASRSSVPAEIDPASSDMRRLGVPVERFALRNGDLSVEASHRDNALTDGFYEPEEGFRWTNGNARLPGLWQRRFPGGFTLDIYLVPNVLGYRSAGAGLDAIAAGAGGDQRLPNPEMAGAIVGTIGDGGALPAAWHFYSEAGLRCAVIASGREGALDHVDLRIYGTPSATTNVNQLFFAGAREVPAAAGEEWTIAVHAALLAGSLENVRAVEIGAALNRVDGTYSSWIGARSLTPRREPLAARRFALTRTVGDRGAAYLTPLLQLAVTEGRPIDLVMRVGGPYAGLARRSGSGRRVAALGA